MSLRIVLAWISAAVLAGCGSGEGKKDDGGILNPPDPEAGASASLDGNSGLAVLSADVSIVDLGTFELASHSKTANVTITNLGPSASGVLAVSTTNADLSVSGCAGEVLAAQSSCTVSIMAKPMTAGPIAGKVEVVDVVGSGATITVTGIASIPGWQLNISPAPFDLGLVPQGETASGTIALSNPTPFDIDSIVLQISGSGFALGPGTCRGLLKAAESCYIAINFTAGLIPGVFHGTLTVTKGGMIKMVPLTATVP